MLRLTNINFAYEGDKPVLKDISLNIPPGSFNVFVGTSGSGKTTLLRIIAELLHPTSGMIDIDERMGMVFQNGALLPWLSAEDNVSLALSALGETKTTVIKHAHLALKRVGLMDLKDRLPRELSGGQRQRVGLARALAVSPDLLILDEPFSALDVNTAKSLREDLLSIWQELNITVLMVSHSVEEAVELAQNIYALKDGKLHEPVKVDLAYPRDTDSNEFVEYVRRVKRLL